MKKEKAKIRHYTSFARDYDGAFSSDLNYCRWSADSIINLLELKKDDRLVDLGGGTGFFSSLIHKNGCLDNKVLCVDTCKKMLEKAGNYDNVFTMCESASSFSGKDELKYDKIFIKEAVHHFENRIDIFSQIYNHLTYHGIICIVTRPQIPEFPLFKSALKSFEQSQPDYNIFAAELEKAGFDVNVHQKAYPFKIKKNRWFELIKQKFMSNLAQFSDIEIDDGLKELEEHYHDSDFFFFNDILIYIVGYKTD